MADSHIPSHSRRSLGRILFPAKTEVRQGCSLSLLLSIIVIDWVSRTAYSSSTEKTVDTGITFWISSYRQWHLLPSSSPPGFSTLVIQPRNNTVTSKWPGIYINAQRTKMIRINSKQTDSIKIRNTRYSPTNLIESIVSTFEAQMKAPRQGKRRVNSCFFCDVKTSVES